MCWPYYRALRCHKNPNPKRPCAQWKIVFLKPYDYYSYCTWSSVVGLKMWFYFVGNPSVNPELIKGIPLLFPAPLWGSHHHSFLALQDVDGCYEVTKVRSYKTHVEFTSQKSLTNSWTQITQRCAVDNTCIFSFGSSPKVCDTESFSRESTFSWTNHVLVQVLLCSHVRWKSYLHFSYLLLNVSVVQEELATLPIHHDMDGTSCLFVKDTWSIKYSVHTHTVQ